MLDYLQLALRRPEAAKAIGVSERYLFNLTEPRGPIPCKRLGGRGGVILYRVEDLQEWLRSHSDDAPSSDA